MSKHGNFGLETLLGPQRARILRLLDRPATCGAIAGALLIAPGGVTHHLRSLEAAGLARRRRRGREVVVERTRRGRALLALYEPALRAGYRKLA